MSVRVPAMSVLPPVRKDRIITQLPQVTVLQARPVFFPPRFTASRVLLPLPQCFRTDAALHTKEDFSDKVKTACQEKRTGTVGWAQLPRSRGGAVLFWHLFCSLAPLLFLSPDLKSLRSLWWATWLWGKPAWLTGNTHRLLGECRTQTGLLYWSTRCYRIVELFGLLFVCYE